MVIPVRLLGKAPYSYDGKNLAEFISGLYPVIISYAEAIGSDGNKKEE